MNFQKLAELADDHGPLYLLQRPKIGHLASKSAATDRTTANSRLYLRQSEHSGEAFLLGS
jgi:hypothetical protein